MLTIDVISVHVICGAGALIGAAMLRLADSPQPDAAAALRICNRGLLVLGVSMLSLLLPGSAELPLVQVIISMGTLVCTAMCGWGLGRLAGETVPTGAMVAVIGAMVALTLAAMPFGPHGLSIAVALGLVVTSLLAMWLVRRMVVAPRNLSARVLGLLMVVLGFSSLLRLYFTLRYRGAPHSHLMLMPVEAQSLFAVFYGVLPIVVSTLQMVSVNAQLRQNLDELAERLRLAIADAPWTKITNEAIDVTASVGVTLVELGESLDDALRRADAALYRAKREGRNPVQVSVEAA